MKAIATRVLSAIIFSTSLLSAVSAEAQPLSNTCRFTSGPKAGTAQTFPGVMPIPIGAPCQDGVASWGVAIPNQGLTANVAHDADFDYTNGSATCTIDGNEVPYMPVRNLPKSGLATIKNGQPVILISSQ
jgi:hypothetical protein